MLIKLNFTGGKSFSQVFRILAEIVAQPTYTSVSALTAGATNNGWISDLLQNLDAASSYIYRTKDTTGVVSHIARTSSGSTTIAPFDFVLEFPTYDATSTKQYYKLSSTSVTSPYAITEQYSNTVNASTLMSSTQWSTSVSTTGSTSQGTTIAFAGTTTTARTVHSNAATQPVYTLWAYITPTSFVWTAILSPAGFQPSGWHGTNSYYSNNTNAAGSMYSQYRRYDYWNTSSNNILPFVYMNPNSTYLLPFNTTGELGITNPNSSTATECTFNFYNYINATPGTGTTFPVAYAQKGAVGIGTRYADTFALTTSAGSSVNATDPCYGAILNTSTVQTRIPSSDLLTKGFSILPLTIRNMNICMLGGNISDIGDFYLFNGDYFPGDEFSYNNRTFVIFPVGLGYTTRLGLAIPKE
jgi:hypothetical protein